MAAQAPICDFGWKAPDFSLPATDGRSYALADVAGEKATLIVFLSNHCPYVRAITDRLVADVETLKAAGVGVAGICANDAVAYPADSFENMKRFAAERAFNFPYLHDATQAVARAYGAVCTPDFFGFDAGLGLQYRGRLDEGRTSQPPPGARRELVEAMLAIAQTGQGPAEQIPSMGCSIKWRRAA